MVPCWVVQLVMPMPIMIWLAVIVEAGIGNWIDMVILLLIQFINASIGWCVQLSDQHSQLHRAELLARQHAQSQHSFGVSVEAAEPTEVLCSWTTMVLEAALDAWQ